MASSSDSESDSEPVEPEDAAWDQEAPWDRAALLASFAPPRWVSAERAAAFSGEQHDDGPRSDELDDSDSDSDSGSDAYSELSASGHGSSGSARTPTGWLSGEAGRQIDHAGLIARMDRVAAATREESDAGEWASTEEILKSLDWGGRDTWQNELLPELSDPVGLGRNVRRRTDRSCSGGGASGWNRMRSLSGRATTAKPRIVSSLSQFDFENLTETDIFGMADDVKIATVQELVGRPDVRDIPRADELLGTLVAKRAKRQAQVDKWAAYQVERDAIAAGCEVAAPDAADTPIADRHNVAHPAAGGLPPAEQPRAGSTTPPQMLAQIEHWPPQQQQPAPQQLVEIRRKVPLLSQKVKQRPILAPAGCFRACLNGCTCPARDRGLPPAVPAVTKSLKRECTGSVDRAIALCDSLGQPVTLERQPLTQEEEEAERELQATGQALLERYAQARELVANEAAAVKADTSGSDSQQVQQQRQLTGLSKGVPPPQPQLQRQPSPPPGVSLSPADKLRARGLGSLSSGDVGVVASAATADAAAVDVALERTSLTNFRLPPAQGVDRPPNGSRQQQRQQQQQHGNGGSSAEPSPSAARRLQLRNTYQQHEASHTHRSPESAEDKAMSILADGNEALSVGRHDAAIELFEKSLEVCPGNAALAARLTHAIGVRREVKRVVGQWLRAPGASGFASAHRRPSPGAIHRGIVAERASTPGTALRRQAVFQGWQGRLCWRHRRGGSGPAAAAEQESGSGGP